MIKTLIAALIIVFFFIFTIPVLFILWIIGKINMKVHDTIAYGIMRGAFAFILFVCGVKITVNGRENIPTDTPVLYVGNHRSFFDIIVLYRYSVGVTGFISKKEWKKVPVLGHWISCLHGIFLDRDNIKEGLKAILEAIDNVKTQGVSYAIFPEGTRNHNKEMLPFKEGSMKIATKGGCPIIPVAMTHTDDLLENHMPYISGGKVSITFGEPIYPDKISKEETKFLGAKTRDIIQGMIDEMD